MLWLCKRIFSDMSMLIKIKDGLGKAYKAHVNSRNALRVSIVDSPSDDDLENLTTKKLFRGFLADSGGGLGLNVNGSTTPVDFQLSANSSRLYWITSLRFLFEGNNLELDTNDFRRFGLATNQNAELTNGLQLFVFQGGVQTDIFASPVKTMGQFLSYSDSFLNIKNAITSQSDFLSFDFNFGVPVLIVAGSNDRVVVRVSDNLTAIDSFKVVVRGYQEIL